MTYLISYDIGSDKLRKKISDRLQADGLVRIQYSVFVGPMKEAVYFRLMDWIEGKLKEYEGEGDKVLSINISSVGIEKFGILGKEDLDLAEILGMKNTLFL